MMTRIKQSVFVTLMAGLSITSFAQTSHVPNGWYLKDKVTDGYYGISLDKAYNFVKGKQSKTVLVAVIDSGIDTTHEDLKSILWTNPKEIPGNGIDDDGNGYVDDVHGWNFIGGRDGRNVKEDSYEAARLYHKYKNKFADVDPATLSAEDRALYNMWRKAEKDITPNTENALNLVLIRNAYKSALKGDSILKIKLNKSVYTGQDVENFAAADDEAKSAKKRVMVLYQGLSIDLDRSNKEVLNEIEEYLSGEERKAEALNKAPKDYRGEIVKDNYDDINDRYYGNNDIMAGTPFHGTHVSGIIAAARNNGKGIDGIANNVRIMMVRAVPDGDEHDKDIALAIRYAVDNGAKIINMSFGKGFSPEKKWVDDAVKYAESKGVLLVHAAGNDAADVDTVNNYPNPLLLADNKKVTNWITVGASGDPKIGGLVANFSNYGKKEVDVFAPGVQIYSTVPGGNTYGNAQGTSMASPVVAGMAAFVLSYYPNLTVQQLKSVIEKSTVKPGVKVKNPENGESVDLSDLSVSGGVINAYEAVKLAATLKGNPAPVKPAPVKIPLKTKSTVKKTKKA